ncbi:MAG: (Fe-S)-binding protein [Thermoanaerobacteraceae bacterium]|nr:(Fe-S)-binding protein [Thermoanaerobacteraceae bacterium]
MHELPLIEHFKRKINYVPCIAGSDLLVETIIIDFDLSELLPYINAVAEKAKYIPELNWIKFKFHGFPHKYQDGTWDVAVHQNTISVRAFLDKDTADKVSDECINYINDIIFHKEEIIPSYKEWKQPKAIDIIKYLPKTNCGKCGFATCIAFAAKLALGETDLINCPELSKEPDKRQKLLELLGN